jgi:hypothetical protein
MFLTNLFKKKKKKIDLISLIYIILFYYKIFLNFLTFRPLIINVTDNLYSNCELYYFQNENCAYIWNTSSSFTDQVEEKILFYINGFDGNCSTRFNIMKRLGSIIPADYTIVQFELSGYGLSSYSECNLTSIQKILLENMNFLMNQFPDIKDYSIFTENEGLVAIAPILSSLHVKPKSLLHLNPEKSLFEYMKNKYSSYMIPFFFSYYFDKSIEKTIESYFLKNTSSSFYFLQNDNFDEDDFDLYFDYDFVPPCQKHRLRIKGKGVTSLILNDNFDNLQSFFKNL